MCSEREEVEQCWFSTTAGEGIPIFQPWELGEVGMYDAPSLNHAGSIIIQLSSSLLSCPRARMSGYFPACLPYSLLRASSSLSCPVFASVWSLGFSVMRRAIKGLRIQVWASDMSRLSPGSATLMYLILTKLLSLAPPHFPPLCFCIDSNHAFLVGLLRD